MRRRDDRMENELRELLRQEAGRVDVTGLAIAPAVRRARWRLARTAVVATVAASVMAYGGFLGARALARMAGPPLLPAGACGARWQVATDPNLVGRDASVWGVTATSPDDAWAIGQMGLPDPGPLIDHWDGTSWTPIPAPAVQAFGAIAAVSSEDVWVTGSDPVVPTGRDSASPSNRTVVEHWDGLRWSAIPIPAPATKGSLSSLAVVSRDDVWAAGSTEADSSPLMLHWDGARWSEVPSPSSPDGSMSVTSIAAAGPDDVWAVGIYQPERGPFSTSFAMHWDGLEWRIVRMPGDRTARRGAAVAATADGQAWVAIQEGALGGRETTGSILEHWDGSRWTLVPTPFGRGGSFTGVQAFSPDDVWVHGTEDDGDPLIAHWNGFSWTVEAIPPLPQGIRTVWAMAGAGGAVWAVGTSDQPIPVGRAFVLRSCPARGP